MKPKLVIFDCDGVLVDTERATNEVMAANLSGYGLKISVDECTSLFVGGTMASAADEVRRMGYPLPPNWTDEMYAQMFARLRKGVDVIKGLPELLDQLDHAKIPYCVGSNGPMDKMEITLTPSGLWDRFEGRIYSPHVIGLELAKPNAGLYLHAARAMGVDRRDCVVIEDSQNGARGAQAAGIRCFGFTRETNAEDLEAVGAIPFADMSQLPELLNL